MTSFVNSFGLQIVLLVNMDMDASTLAAGAKGIIVILRLDIANLAVTIRKDTIYLRFVK